MTTSPFVHLHVHSCYSLRRGASGLHTLLTRVKALGMPAVALTDVNAMYGIVPFYTAAKGMDLHPVLGVEIRGDGGPAGCAGGAENGGRLRGAQSPAVGWGDAKDAGRGGSKTNHKDTKSTKEERGPAGCAEGGENGGRLRAAQSPDVGKGAAKDAGRGGSKIIALARNLEGYSNLCRLTTARQLNADFDLLRACLRYQEGVYFLTDDESLLAALAEQVPGWRVFAALCPRPGRAHRERLRRLCLTARHRGLGCVATNDVFFATPEDYATHRTLRAIDHIVAQEQLDAGEHDVAPPDAWLKSAAEMAEALPEWPDALAQSLAIAEDCRVELPMGRPLFPAVPDEVLEPPHPASLAAPFPTSGLCAARNRPPASSALRATVPRSPYARLRAACEAGLRERYGPQPAPAVRARLDYELEVIDRLGFTPYFLIVHDIVRFAQREGIPCVGRGSAADSLATYALGIGGVDPLRYDLYFERFLNLGRTDCPDIDIDFCWRRRDDVVDYVYRTYGADRVAMICTYNTFGARSAFRDVAKTFGLPLEEIDRLSSRLPHANVANIRAALEQFPECRDLPFDEEPYRSILAQAERIDGFPRHLGIHPCGIVIAPTPLTDLVPLEMATKGLVVTQYDMHPIEALGLVKIDLLGQRALSIVTDAARIVREQYGMPMELERLPEPDPKVAELARTGDTLGCFQIDSPGMRNLLQQIRAESRMDLIMALSLIRPGPAASGMKETFVRRARGMEPVPDVDPRLTRLLGDTFGVLLYQEDLLRIAHKLAGFSRADADALRKAMSKKRSPERMAKLRARFLAGCAGQGVQAAVAQELWTRMSNFAGYSYCKAHACTYGHISYQGLWLKAYYPTAFYAGVLNNAAGMYSARTYLEDARRHGVAIRPVDVHASDYWTTVEVVGQVGCAEGAESGGRLRVAQSPAVGWGDAKDAGQGGSNDGRLRGAQSPDAGPGGSNGGRLCGAQSPDAGQGGSNGGRLCGAQSPDAGQGGSNDGRLRGAQSPDAGQGGSNGGRLRGAQSPAVGGGDAKDAGWGGSNGGRLCGAQSPDAGPGGSNGGRLCGAQSPDAGPGGSKDSGRGDSKNTKEERRPAGCAEGAEAGSGPGGSKEPAAALRIGLWHVGVLAKAHAESIVAARPFADLRDLCRRVPLERDEVEALIRCGACDGFGLTRPQLLWEVAQSFGAIQRGRHAEQPLFPGAVFVDHLPLPPDLPEYGAALKLEMEQDVLGLELSLHPLAPFRDALAAYPLVPAAELRQHAGRHVQVGGWLVASRRVVTKRQDYMRFLTLEDATGLVEVVLFPETYQAYGHLVRGHGPYIVNGLVDDAYGACTLTAESLTVLDAPD